MADSRSPRPATRMHCPRPLALPAATLLLLVGALPAPPSAVQDPARLGEEAAELLDENRAGDALEKVQLALEYEPDSTALLELAARACAALDRKDEAYWYATLGLDIAAGSGESKASGGRLADLAASLRPIETKPEDLLEDYAQNLFRLAQTCQRKKLYANAVDLLARCRGTRFDERAQARLDKLFSNEKAVQALLASGVDIPAKPVTKRSPEWIAREDRKHAAWDDAYELKGKYYTIITNLGYEMAQSMALAMGQMNGFYRRVFHYKERGGSMRRCVIKVYATREQFDEHENMADSPTIRGFFVPLENRVATYDPRSEGGPLTSLWSTLFHEASHQFTRAVSTELLPAWLNEGTASYFEGATLLPNGFVQTNQIPRSRLNNLLALLEMGTPTVEMVVSYFQPGSYPGEYYPFGWGLSYFLQNYEDEGSERVYVPIYQDYLKSYKSGGKHDPLERFVEYFVVGAEQRGVEGFDDFVERWTAWIRDLGQVWAGGAEKADLLVERARKQRANGKPEFAVESYRWSLQKRDDARTRFELAETLLELREIDGAMHGYRKVLELAGGQSDHGVELPGFDGQSADDVARMCLERITAINRNVGEGLAKADADFAAAVADTARGFLEAGYPRSSVQLLDTSASVLGDAGSLRELQRRIEEDEGIDIRRWRRLQVGADLALWQGGDDWRAADGDVHVETDRLVTLLYRGDVPDAYRLEVRILPGASKGFPVFGIIFGSNNQTGLRIFGILREIRMAALIGLKQGPEILERIAPMPEIGDEGLTLAIEVTPGRVGFFLQGKEVKELQIPAAELRGRIGLFGQDVEATFRGARLRY